MFKNKAENKSGGWFVAAISWILVNTVFRGFVKSLDNLISKKDREEVIKASNEFKKSVGNLKNVLDRPEVRRELDKAGVKPEDFPWYDSTYKDETYQMKEKKEIKEVKPKKKEYNGRKKLVAGNDVYMEEENIIIDELKRRAIANSKSEGKKLIELEEKITYFVKAAKYMINKKICSIDLFCNALKINRNIADYVIEKLEYAGIIFADYSAGELNALIESKESLEIIIIGTDLNKLFGDEIKNKEEN